MRKFLVDTDTASDDAIALCMALRNPTIEVVAITTVAGNVPVTQATQNALYTVELCDVDAPVFSGADQPLMRDLRSAQNVHGHDGMGDIGLKLTGREPAGGAGVEMIIQTLRQHPGEVTLVALGPLTNLATALIAAPDIAELPERVVIMGGTGDHGPGNVTPTAEFNFWVDPEAVKVVLRSGMKVELVGWDISITSAVVDEDRRNRLRAIDTTLATFAIEIQGTVADFIARTTDLPGPDLPDPIAMAWAIDPSVGTASLRGVDISTGDQPLEGTLIVDRSGTAGIATQALLVDAYPTDAFFSMLEEALG